MLAKPGIAILLIFCAVFAQAQDSLVIGSVSQKYLQGISDKVSSLDKKLERKSFAALEKMRKEEEKIARKLFKTDSTKARELLTNTQERYKKLEERLQGISTSNYVPSLDTLSSSLKFLQQNPQLLAIGKNTTGKLNDALGNVTALEDQFKKAEEIRRFLKERKQFLSDKLQNLGFAKNLKKLNKQVYYFNEQLNEYKSLLSDHKKAERKAIELLSKTKLFKDFMRKNSALASLFRIPGDPNDPSSMVSLAGLQTRSQVNGLIQQQLSAGGPGAQAQFSQNVRDAQSQMNALKDKVNKLGGSGNDMEMPDGFKPNKQKTKSFWNRLEYGTNVQSQKGSAFLPVTSDLGLTVGYKLNDRSIIGIGGSYKLGWGKDLRHLRITNEGVGIRSFIDWKIKGSFWLTGGYEQNYRTAFQNFEQLRDMNAWQQSGLVGFSKIVSLKTKFFKKTKMQLLWDFLSNEQVPVTQPIVFRIGYNF